MKIIFLFAWTLLATAGFAQQGWKLKLDHKILLNATEENEEANKVSLKAAEVRKAKQLVLHYGKVEENKDWERTITLYNEQDQVLATQKGKKFALTTARLQQFFKTSKTLKIYTTALPKDPQLAARIRVRRVHLATVVMQ